MTLNSIRNRFRDQVKPNYYTLNAFFRCYQYLPGFLYARIQIMPKRWKNENMDPAGM